MKIFEFLIFDSSSTERVFHVEARFPSTLSEIDALCVDFQMCLPFQAPSVREMCCVCFRMCPSFRSPSVTATSLTEGAQKDTHSIPLSLRMLEKTDRLGNIQIQRVALSESARKDGHIRKHTAHRPHWRCSEMVVPS